jgi:molybdopterin/thiamine biosynthesis adenylyltransferase
MHDKSVAQTEELLAWQPLIFDCTEERDRKELNEFATTAKVWRTHDTIIQQVKDLLYERHPQWIKNPVSQAQVQIEIEKLTGGAPLGHYGCWIYYPWSGMLVHLLPAEEFQELRGNRNRNKITAEEQKKLAQLTIGVVGLSVGNAVAAALAMEGIGGCLKLADFDQLDLSNMNRVQATVADIGLSKTVLCMRQIYGMNPYAHVVPFMDGLTEENLDEFYTGYPKLDLIVDECDDIRMKVLLRERAKALQVPVLMETSNRGMLDVERYDLEPERPIFHGLLGNVTSADIPVDLAMEEKIKFVIPIIGLESLSTRSAASMSEIGRTISTWPQLGSEVILGGATISTAIRQWALGEPLASGRRYIDLTELVSTEITQYADAIEGFTRLGMDDN